MYNTHTHYLILHTTLHIICLDQQQMNAMRCTTVAPVEAGSHVCRMSEAASKEQLRQLIETRDCAADGERVAADIEAEDYHRR